MMQAFAAVIGLGLFGCAWLMSSILSSYGLAILLGFFIPYVIALISQGICFLIGMENEELGGKIAIAVDMCHGFNIAGCGHVVFH